LHPDFSQIRGTGSSGFDDRHHTEAAEAPAVGVEEDRRVGTVSVIPCFEVRVKRVGGLRPKGARSLLASLAEDAHLGRCFEA